MKNFSVIKFAITILVSLIGMYLVSCNRSKDTKDKQDIQDITECYKFADEHWVEDDYRAWLQDSLNILSGSDQDSFWNEEKNWWDWLSHHLPDKKDDQYYEMIGKYDQFRFGWDDFPEDLEEKHRNEYLECLDRAAKNKKLSPTRSE